MKKTIFFVICVFCVTVASAQISVPDRPNRPSYLDHSGQDSGFWLAGEATAGSTIMFDNTNTLRSGLAVVGGYMMNEYLKFGVGLGVNIYLVNNKKVRVDEDIPFTLPLFLDVRGNLISQEDREVVPYWSFDIGGAIRDGFFLSPTIGLRIGEKRDSWLVGLSYGLNSVRTVDGMVSTLALKVGYEF
jgi:hypothetical protein